MSTTTGSASTQTKTKKEGVQIKGRDVIYLNAPEICFPENAPLKNTEKRELYAILDELFQLEPGGGDDDWQPPEWWIPVPEPGDYDIYILLQAYTDNYGYGKEFKYMLGRETDGYIGYGHVHCDWGDGTENDYYEKGYPQHTYTEDGQYLIHITADENTTFCKGDANNQARWLIFKSGAKMTFFCDDFDKNNRYYIMYTFGGKYSKHIKINHPKGVPLDKRNDFFSFCQSLQKLEMNQIKPENIADGTFSRCYALKSFPIDFDNITSVGKNAFSECSLNKLHMENCLSIDHGAFASNYTDLETVVLPNCKSIGNSAFASCYRLKSVYAPKCTFIDNSAFVSCYNLQEIVVADDCTFGTNCFANCYSLYPRPDGSTN